MELGSVALNAETTGGIADDPAFRELAEGAEVGAESDLAELADGGLVGAPGRGDRAGGADPVRRGSRPGRRRLDARRAPPRRCKRGRRLRRRARMAGSASRRSPSASAAAPRRPGRSPAPTPPRTRRRRLIADVFAAKAGETVMRADGDAVMLARVREVLPFDPDEAANAEALSGLEAQLRDQVADDALALFTAALRDAAGVRVNQGRVDATLARFP